MRKARPWEWPAVAQYLTGPWCQRHQAACTPTWDRAHAGVSTAHHSAKAASLQTTHNSNVPNGSQACSSSGRETAHAQTHRHAQRKMAPHFLASPARTQNFQPTSAWPKLAWSACSRGNHAQSPSFPSYPLLWAVGGTTPHTARQTQAARHSTWTARGMGWACSLTQPALRTTAQLDRAATCRWAGESNEREC